MTDAHGVGASFDYQLRNGTSRWVVRSIALPDGTAVQYEYGTSGGNLDRLTRVVHASGDVSQFSRTWHASSQSWALRLRDATGGDARTWKTVYVTGPTYKTSDNVVHKQTPNLVRRVVNESNEQVYQAMEHPDDPNTTFYREGPSRITRLVVDASGLPREAARATTVSANPLQASYVVVESYDGDVLQMITEVTDGFGNVRRLGRDSRTRGITSVVARDGSTASFVLNGFLQPTRTIDRIGRVTQVEYDDRGNPLAITHAFDLGAQATWSYAYNARGQVTRVTDANGNPTDHGYDAAGFLTSITDPPDLGEGSRAVRRFELSAVGRLSATVDASGRRVFFQLRQPGPAAVRELPRQHERDLHLRHRQHGRPPGVQDRPQRHPRAVPVRRHPPGHRHHPGRWPTGADRRPPSSTCPAPSSPRSRSSPASGWSSPTTSGCGPSARSCSSTERPPSPRSGAGTSSTGRS